MSAMQPPDGSTSAPADATVGLIRKDPDAIKLFIGQVPKTMDADALRPLFAEFGEVFDLAIIRDKQTGMHRGEKSKL
jgi:CUG-BP- and ETR3-like factor